MSPQFPRRLITVSEYYRMAEVGILKENEQVELLNGELIRLSPIGSRHAMCVNKITRLFSNILPSEVFVAVQNPVYLNSLTEPEPDIAIVRGPLDRYADHHPCPEDVLLLIEVADSTYRKDREIKLPLYAKNGIQESWIIHMEREEIEVYHSPSSESYETRKVFQKGEFISISSLGLEAEVAQML
ncbi:MAG: Uma2 family endonuclease [Bacteroidota bacterium]